MFKIFKVEDAKRIFSDIFTYLVWRFFGALAISIFSNELIAIFLQKVCPGKQHRANGGNDLCPFGFYYFLQTPLILKRRLYVIASLSCFAALLNIILSFY